jgi:hypothetical protein
MPARWVALLRALGALAFLLSGACTDVSALPAGEEEPVREGAPAGDGADDDDEPVGDPERDPSEAEAAPPPPPAPARDRSLPFDGPTWKMATIVFRQTDVTVPVGGVDRRVVTTMSPQRYAKAQAAAAGVVDAFEAWSSGRARATMEVIDVPVLRKVSAIGDASRGFWIAPADVKDVLAEHAPRGRFDSVYMLWEPGSGANAVPVCCAWGRGPGDDTNGMTYAVVTPNTGSEGMIHEWLHGGAAFYRAKGHDTPDPHENRVFGFPSAIGGSWSHWYTALLSSQLVRAGKVSGFTTGVWRTGTPTAWVGGDVAPEPRPRLPKPTVLEAKRWDADWVYASWDPVRGPSHYTLFLAVVGPDGASGRALRAYTSGSTDRGAFNYFYWPKAEVCSLGRGALKLRFRIWSDADATSAVDRDLPETFLCP